MNTFLDIFFGTFAVTASLLGLIFKIDKIIKTNSVKSFSLYYAIIGVVAYSVMLIWLISVLFENMSEANSWQGDISYNVIQGMQMLDIFNSTLCLGCTVFILMKKIQEIKLGHNHWRKFKISGKEWAAISLITIAIVAIIALTLYSFNKERSNYDTWLWVLILGTCSTILVTLANFPFVVQIILTRNTWTLSVFTCAFVAIEEIAWFVYDAEQMISSKNFSIFPALFEDAILIGLFLLVFVIKLINTINAKKHKISEEKYYEKFIIKGK